MNGLRKAVNRAAWLGISAVTACLAILALAGPASAANAVHTDKGWLRGAATAQTNQYLGVPYAAPPVGDLRWRAPQPPAGWKGVRNAISFGPHCAQTESPYGAASTSEDCLYLNVYTPRADDDDGWGFKASSHGRGHGHGHGRKHHGRGHDKKLPVMVWFHGGGLSVGESDDYDPVRLVAQGRIVVTVNYRLGLLGFLAHPALTAEAGASGDYGFMDQQAALRWVQRNIKNFGGDRRDVTIFGQSAGGLSVHVHLASPLSAGLFDRAIVHSGAYSLQQPTLAQGEQRGTDVATTLGCTDQTAACLRSVPVETLLANAPAVDTIIPNIDGRVLPQSIGDAFSSGKFNHVPVIEGTTHDEFAAFAYSNIEAPIGVFAWAPALYSTVVSQLVQATGLPTTADAVTAEYPLSPTATSSAANVIAIGTDALFACPARRSSQLLSKYVRTFEYEFNDPDAPQPFLPPASFDYGAYHASELAYLFDSTTLGGHAPFTPDQEALAGAMVRYWTQFAAKGDPNSWGTPRWPAYTASGDLVQSLEPPTPKTTSAFAADHHCGFWDALGAG